MKKPMVWTLLAACVLVAWPAGASTFLAMSQEEMVKQADAVVVGKVLQVSSFRDPSGAVILSEATIEVERTVFGEASGAVVVRTFGGTVDGYTVEAEGFPKFRNGDRVLVYLSDEVGGISQVVGYRLGEYKVLRDREGEDVAVPTLERGVRLLAADGTPAPRPRAMRLEALEDQIRATALRVRPRNRF